MLNVSVVGLALIFEMIRNLFLGDAVTKESSLANREWEQKVLYNQESLRLD